MERKLNFETLAIQSTTLEDKSFFSVSSPIYLTTTFERNDDGSYPGDFVYSRSDNPNRRLLEQSMAILENGETGLAFSSGLAAISAVFQSLGPVTHVLLPDDVYYAAKKLLANIFSPFGISYSLVDMSDLVRVKEAIRKETALIWLETPSNPRLKICDIEAIAHLAHEAGAICGVDNTWATPVHQNPLNSGADLVMHATTKYIGGHSDVLGGCLVLKDAILAEKLRQIQTLSGGVPSPFECWLVTRGIKTLYVRVMAQSSNALQLAQYLQSHPKIEKVHYPGLESHPQFGLAKKQMKKGFGGMLSIQIDGNAADALALTGKLKLFTAATSLGGVESLIEHRKSVEGEDSPTPDNLLRISVGLEHIDDLIEDWDSALKA